MKKYVVSFIVFLFAKNIYAQSLNLTNKEQDFDPIERFLSIADSLKNKLNVTNNQWASYFQIPVISLLSHNPSLDSTTYVNDMKLIYGDSQKYISDSIGLTDNQKSLREYMLHENSIKQTISQMKTTHINDSIKASLFPFLPLQLRTDSVLPKQIYLYLDEGNGGFLGIVFNSMLQTALVNNYKCGIISAHESYHTIAGNIFNSLLNPNLDQASPEINLISILDQIAEEGIADLIDKPILSKANSPLYKQVKDLTKDDYITAPFYINKLDSLFTNAFLTKKLPMINWKDYTKNTGHIPGRFMGMAIQKSGLLNECQKHIGDPISFFEFYQEAARKNKSLPQFSTKSILYLKTLRQNCFK